MNRAKSHEESWSTPQIANYFILTEYLEALCKTLFKLRGSDLLSTAE